MFNEVLCKTKLDQLCSRILLPTYILPELEDYCEDITA